MSKKLPPGLAEQAAKRWSAGVLRELADWPKGRSPIATRYDPVKGGFHVVDDHGGRHFFESEQLEAAEKMHNDPAKKLYKPFDMKQARQDMREIQDAYEKRNAEIHQAIQLAQQQQMLQAYTEQAWEVAEGRCAEAEQANGLAFYTCLALKVADWGVCHNEASVMVKWTCNIAGLPTDRIPLCRPCAERLVKDIGLVVLDYNPNEV